MEAKDTVMDSNTKIISIARNILGSRDGRRPNFPTRGEAIQEVMEATAKEQAEISFNAGIKEVVYWVNENQFPAGKGNGFIAWQKKLKEWKIDG